MTLSAAGGMSSSVPTGSYTITVTVSNGTLTHSTTVSVNITSPPANASPVTIYIVGAAVAIIVIAGVAVYLVRRKRTVK